MKTYTLLELLQEHHKIEIPIIQRNYVQGSDKRIRSPFVKYLIDALTTQRPVELDFTYGSERAGVFIPLDGQQRLTTLWLLHCYLLSTASAESREELVQQLSGLVYETRPSAKDFSLYLLKAYSNYSDEARKLWTSPSAYIRNKSWFDPEWRKEATIEAMLGMLDAFAEHHDTLVAHGVTIASLSLIRFYYLPIQNFGLTNDLYIRMNARGEQLTSFEHFKSSLYKALLDYQRLAEIKEKMEHRWVDNLWSYRGNKYVIDAPFMHYLSFVNEVSHIKQHAETREYRVPAPIVQGQDPYTEVSFVQELYAQDLSAAERLIASYDSIAHLQAIDYPQLLQQKSFAESILGKVVRAKLESTDERILLYSALAYIQRYDGVEGIIPFLRVIRNLSVNTDKQMRDLPVLYATVDSLVQQRDIYAYLAGTTENLRGFNGSQQAEERWKAKLRLARSEASMLLDQIEDYFQGRIDFILLTLLGIKLTSGPAGELWSGAAPQALDLELLERLFQIYEQQSKDEFKSIFGDLLLTDVYRHDTWNSRVVCERDWVRRPGLIRWLMDYLQSEQASDLESYCRRYERTKLKGMIERTAGALETLRNPKEQLFVYYVISRRLLKTGVEGFFSKGRRNFGWIEREGKSGYSSLFTSGIKDCDKEDLIYQIYRRYFRCNCGLQREAALPPERVGKERLQELRQQLLEWVKQE